MKNDATVIGLISLAHGMSHFYQLLLAPLFPFIKDELGVSYAALGFLVALFYTLSGAAAAARRLRRRPLRRARACCWAASRSSSPGMLVAGVCARATRMLALGAALGGIGNSVFHPADFAILNARVERAAPGLRLQRARRGRLRSATRWRRSSASAIGAAVRLAVGAAGRRGARRRLVLAAARRECAAPRRSSGSQARRRPIAQRGAACSSPRRWCCASSTSPCSPRASPACRASASRRWSSSTGSAATARVERAHGVPGGRGARHPGRRLRRGARRRATTWSRPRAWRSAPWRSWCIAMQARSRARRCRPRLALAGLRFGDRRAVARPHRARIHAAGRGRAGVRLRLFGARRRLAGDAGVLRLDARPRPAARACSTPWRPSPSLAMLTVLQLPGTEAPARSSVRVANAFAVQHAQQRRPVLVVRRAVRRA